uniref:Uncharacterized protein n=1 Tax=Arundo donax TaxID=35708 RepID=A0A0A9CGV1_ARUDO
MECITQKGAWISWLDFVLPPTFYPKTMQIMMCLSLSGKIGRWCWQQARGTQHSTGVSSAQDRKHQIRKISASFRNQQNQADSRAREKHNYWLSYGYEILGGGIQSSTR